MTTYTPKSEILTGADLSGSSGDTNRTFVLGNANAVVTNMQIIVSSAILQNVTNFTYDADTLTITFLGKVWDAQPITIDYFTATAAVVT